MLDPTEDQHRAGQRGKIGFEADFRPGAPPRMAARQEAGAGLLNKAYLRDDPKQLTFRVGNISLFYTTADNFLDFTPPELCKKTYVGGSSPLSVIAEKGIGEKASSIKALSQSRL